MVQLDFNKRELKVTEERANWLKLASETIVDQYQGEFVAPHLTNTLQYEVKL